MSLVNPHQVHALSWRLPSAAALTLAADLASEDSRQGILGLLFASLRRGAGMRVLGLRVLATTMYPATATLLPPLISFWLHGPHLYPISMYSRARSIWGF